MINQQILLDLIIWRESYNTGYLRVDNQHRHLVRIINELYHLHASKNKPQKIQQIFLELHNYTVNHFNMEEMMMQQFKYDNYLSHKAEHTQFLLALNEFKTKYLAGNAGINLDMLNFLKDWLIKHIMSTDKKTFSVITEKIRI